jgi:6-phosphogluconate dehydrogenase
MQIGYIGLGKMGENMVKRMLDFDHEVVAYDQDEDAVQRAAEIGAQPADSIEALVNACSEPRLIWIMVPHQFVGNVIDKLQPRLSAGDRLIDGGNSHFQKSMERADQLQSDDITFLDVGVSGGPDGARNGACMMVGGPDEAYQDLEQLFADLTVNGGYGHMGKAGAGHFVKMVHNGIEYGMMQAIAEGFTVMKERGEFDLDLAQVAGVYGNGSVIASNLIDWSGEAFSEFGNSLAGISGEVSHSGEGKWTVETAEEMGIATPVIEQSFDYRLETHGNPTYTGQIVSALRYEFGGHDVFIDDIEVENQE